MRCIEFTYEKGDSFIRRLGLEFGSASRGEGNVAVYQIEPEPGFRTFKAARMYEVRDAVNPWQTEVYATRLARLRAPLWSQRAKEFFIEFVGLGTAISMVLRKLVMEL